MLCKYKNIINYMNDKEVKLKRITPKEKCIKTFNKIFDIILFSYAFTVLIEINLKLLNLQLNYLLIFTLVNILILFYILYNKTICCSKLPNRYI